MKIPRARASQMLITAINPETQYINNSMVLSFPSFPEDPILGLSEKSPAYYFLHSWVGNSGPKDNSNAFVLLYLRFVSARGHIHLISQWFVSA